MAKFNRMLRESCCVIAAIFHVPHMFLFVCFKPAFSFVNIALITVTAIYFVNGPYIGKTKCWFETCKKERMREVKNSNNNATTLSKYAVELGHSVNWENYEILQIETDYHKRKLIELFYINLLSNVLDDKKICLFSIYIPKFVFVISSFQFSRSSTKHKISVLCNRRLF